MQSLDEKIAAAKEAVANDLLYQGTGASVYGNGRPASIGELVNDAANLFSDSYEEYDKIWLSLTAVDWFEYIKG